MSKKSTNNVSHNTNKGEEQMTNTFQQSLQAMEKNLTILREIDIDALNKDEKSNEVMNYVRRTLIVTAYVQSKDITAGSIYITGKALGIIMNSLTMFTNRNTQYKHLLETTEIIHEAGHACWKLTYSLNKAAITNNYIKFLNEEFNIDIPMTSVDDRLKEIDNNLLKNIGQLCPVTLAEAGV